VQKGRAVGARVVDDPRMIPELHICKVKSGLYEARLSYGDEEITELTLHESITDAIRDMASSLPPEISEFLDVRYVDVSLGTQAVAKMKSEAEALAARLVELAAAVWQAEEDRDSRARCSKQACTNPLRAERWR
jgi:hypothetical protein